MKQDICIEIPAAGALVLSTWSDVRLGLTEHFSDENEFESAVLKVKDYLLCHLLPKLNDIADDPNVLKSSNQSYFKENYALLRNQFYEENPTVCELAIVERCHYLDACIERSKKLEFAEALDQMYRLAAFWGDILLSFSDAYLTWDTDKAQLKVVRKNPDTGILYFRFPLTHIYKMWKNRTYRFHSVQFLKTFLTNKEIMQDRDIRTELVGIGQFDVEKGY